MEQPPPVDARNQADVVKQTTALATQFSGWQPRTDGNPDPGQALIGVFGYFTELVIDRLNQALDKNYLAFLNLIGAAQIPPRPARVPLTFHLATSTPVEAVVPAGTLAAAPPLTGDQDEAVFETERSLTITQAQLVASYVSDTENDTYSDRGQQATGGLDQPFAAFAGDQPSPHQLFLACDPVLTQPGTRDAVIALTTADIWQWQNWPVSWAYWDGTGWQQATATATVANGHWQVTLPALPALAPSAIGGIQAGWLRAQLNLPLPPGQAGLAPESVAVSSKAPQDLTLPWSPLGNRFYLSADQVFGAGGALATIQVGVSEPVSGSGLQLSWFYQNSAGWQPLSTGFGFTDGTSSFTQSGQITFHIPMDWTQTIYRNRTGRWLRVDVTAGQYPTPPEIATLTVGYDWQLPALGSITVAGQPATGPAPGPASASPPPAAFYDGTAIDVTMDCYPFGQEPQFNDVFYVACPDALAGPGAVITVSVTLVNPAAGPEPPKPLSRVHTDPDLKIAWEVSDGATWHAVVSPVNFQNNGGFTVTLPDPITQSAVGSQQGYWLRARIAAGGYGDPASYTQNSDQTYTYKPATYSAPVVSAITFAATPAPQSPAPVTACLTWNDFRYSDCTQVASSGHGSPFTPFVPTADTQPALYLGFGQPFSPRAVTLFLEVEPPTPDQVAAGRLADPDPDLALSPGPVQLTWEYAGPDGWTQLGAADETQTLSTRGLVTFVGPADLTARSCFGQDLYWLRLRWQAGTFQLPPQLRRVLLNTVWAAQVITITDEILGSATPDPGQAFTTAQTPVQPGQQLTVRETGDTWVRWDPVPDFYQAGPRDRQYTIDPLTGVIAFGDGTYGMIPPAGQNNICLTYRTGGGEQGNRASATIVELKSSVPYVDGVTNNQPSQGGAPVEPVDRVKARGPRVLRNRDRAVAAQDLVDLVVAASADVASATAIVPVFNQLSLWVDPAAPVPTPDHLAVDAGRMGVIVVPDEPGSPQPTPSLVLLTQVNDYLRERCPPTATLWVAGPEWITVTVTATVIVTGDADAAGDRARMALAQFLHPLTGGPAGQGWPFGQWPHESDLSAVLEAVAGVDHVHTLIVSYQPQTDQAEADLIQAILTRTLDHPSDAPGREQAQWDWIDRALVYSGPHDIAVVLGPAS